MKKSFLFVVFILFAISSLVAQRPKCLDEAILSIGKKDIIGAKRDIDKCFQGNELSADTWLVRANVYVHYYDYELSRKKKDENYVIKEPNAIIIANESFYKALELKSDIKTPAGLFNPKEGQVLTADVINTMAANAMDNKNYAEAIKLFNLVIRSYRVNMTENAKYLAEVYIDLANSYKNLGDDDNYKKTLLDAIKMNVAQRSTYLKLYDLYEKEKDTVKCGEILAQARKAIPGDLEIKGYELGYFVMIGDTSNLRTAAKAIFEQTKTNVDVINFVVEYMVDNKEYLLAEEMIKTGLAIDSNNLKLNQQMALRYFYEAIDYQNISIEKSKERPYNAAVVKAAQNKMNEVLEVAAIWAAKAFEIDQNDEKHNKMYAQILVRLTKPMPDELKEKIDSYNKH